MAYRVRPTNLKEQNIIFSSFFYINFQSKFLILCLNLIITFEKKYKINFWYKKMTPNYWFYIRKKISKFPKKVFLKKLSGLTCASKILKNCMWKYFKNRWMSRYSNFGAFTVPKIVLHNKIINKTPTKKDQFCKMFWRQLSDKSFHKSFKP